MGKGQVTLFVMLGVFILFLSLGLLYFQELSPLRARTVDSAKIADFPPQIRALNDQFTGCVQALSEDYVLMLGMEGGFLIVKIEPEGIQFPLRDWLWKGTDASPSPEEVQKDVADVLAATVDYCVGRYNIPDLQTLEARGSPEADVLFTETAVEVKVIYPLRATFSDATYDLQEFAVVIPVRLRHILDIAKKITVRNHIAPEIVGEQQLYSFDVDPAFRQTSETYRVYTLTDSKSFLRGQKYTFTFGQDFGSLP